MTASEEIKAYEREVNTALRKVYGRTRFEPSEETTPLDALLASEEGQLDEWAAKREAIVMMFQYFSADGFHPAAVLRRVYAVAAHMALPIWSDLTHRERALMLGESHGMQHYRMQRLVDTMRRAGAHSVRAPGQKGLGAASRASRAQQGNSNRKRKRRNPRRRKRT